MSAYLSLVLHAHLPYVRHLEHARFLEESWLFEAVLETYLPLLQFATKWADEGLPVRLTLSLSPALTAMLDDPNLQVRHENRLLVLRETARRQSVEGPLELRGVAHEYFKRFTRHLDFAQKIRWDILRAFRQLADQDILELATTSATHAILPFYAAQPNQLNAQVAAAVSSHLANLHDRPNGFWLPECAYTSAVEPTLVRNGVQWFALESHGLLAANPSPAMGVYAPVFTPQGLAVFGRDPDSARQVWSRDEGYPGDPRYRDFYRDIGFDRPVAEVEAALPCPGHPGFTGLKFHAITDRASKQKVAYRLHMASQAVCEHAAHFLQQRLDQANRIRPGLDRPPLFFCPYDAELFGHWWYEGPDFLDALVRLIANQSELELVTPSGYLSRHTELELVEPAPSTWGEGGFAATWLNASNSWILSEALALGTEFTNTLKLCLRPTDLQKRTLRQAGRELLLAQASDWPFQLHHRTSAEYATQRFKNHVAACRELLRGLGEVEASQHLKFLAQRESSMQFLPNIDLAWWKT